MSIVCFFAKAAGLTIKPNSFLQSEGLLKRTSTNIIPKFPRYLFRILKMVNSDLILDLLLSTSRSFAVIAR